MKTNNLYIKNFEREERDLLSLSLYTLPIPEGTISHRIVDIRYMYCCYLYSFYFREFWVFCRRYIEAKGIFDYYI